MPTTMFYLLATLSVLAAVGMISQRHPLTAAFYLVLCFLGLAGIYASLMAPLLAILQILVYAGAIMALVVFVIMLLNVRDEDLPHEPNMGLQLGLAGLVATGIFAILERVIWKFPAEPVAAESLPQGFGGINAVGQHLFNTFTFPFEIISILLTVAVVGVVVLAKRRI